MGRNDRRCGQLVVLAGALLAAALLSGCFQPLYGERTASGGSGLRGALSTVEVSPIAALPNTPTARLAVQIRNDLMFNFTGGGQRPSSTHRLKVDISGSSVVLATNPVTGTPSLENYTLNASYSLVEIASGKSVVQGRTTTTVSNNPSGAQRFATASGMRDAELRAAKVISENITTRLASYFVSGT